MPGAVRRVGFDAIRAVRNATGLGNYSRSILQALHQFDPQLALYLYSPLPPRPRFDDFMTELGTPLHLPPQGTANALSRSLWRTFRLGRAVARDRVELYHGLSHEIPRDLPITGIPSVVSFADLIYEKFPRYFPIADRWSYRWRYRWSAHHATAIVAISKQTRDDLIEWYRIDPARIAVIPPARRSSFADPATDAERAAVRDRYHLPAEFLLSVGTLEPRKNQHVLVQALATMPAGKVLPLVLVGRDGGSRRTLDQLISRLRLGERVRIVTDVATADLPALMQSATIFLYPSLVEGFGMPIAEALSAGTPVIASSGGCFTEAGGPGSRYLAAGDADAWGSTMADLLADSDARSAMRDAGRRWAEQFDGDRLSAQLVAVYEAVVADARLPARPLIADTGVEQPD